MVFRFSSDELENKSSPTWSTFKEGESELDLDKILCEEWDKRMKAGHFRYDLKDCRTRVLKGQYTHILILNALRAQERRKPEYIESLDKPFDPNRFNFTKVKNEEKICLFQPTDDFLTSANSDSDEDESKHLILINVSPLGYGHSLLVPDVDKQIPQKLTLNGVKLSVAAQALSNNPGLLIGFNSLCALASVNHQHLHLWYVEEQLSIQSARVKHIGSGMYETEGMTSRAFVFQLHGSTVNRISEKAFSVINHFQVNNIAHNVLLTKGSQFSEPADSTNRTIRIYIWPRVSVTGSKNETKVMFNVAVAELAGHILMYAPEFYENIKEQDISDRIKEFTFPDEEFDSITDQVKRVLETVP